MGPASRKSARKRVESPSGEMPAAKKNTRSTASVDDDMVLDSEADEDSDSVNIIPNVSKAPSKAKRGGHGGRGGSRGGRSARAPTHAPPADDDDDAGDDADTLIAEAVQKGGKKPLKSALKQTPKAARTRTPVPSAPSYFKWEVPDFDAYIPSKAKALVIGSTVGAPIPYMLSKSD